MSNRRKLRLAPRHHLTIPARALMLRTGQVLHSLGERRGAHAWKSDDGLLVSATVIRGVLAVGIHRDDSLPSGQEINAVTEALYPDSATVHLLLNEPEGWASLLATVEQPQMLRGAA